MRSRGRFTPVTFYQMVYTDETWYVVRNIRGCTGFVGPSSKPVPLTDAEVEKMGVETKVVEVSYKRVTRSELQSSRLSICRSGRRCRYRQNYVRVTVSMFGRDTSVELELDQVEAID